MCPRNFQVRGPEKKPHFHTCFHNYTSVWLEEPEVCNKHVCFFFGLRTSNFAESRFGLDGQTDRQLTVIQRTHTQINHLMVSFEGGRGGGGGGGGRREEGGGGAEREFFFTSDPGGQVDS